MAFRIGDSGAPARRKPLSRRLRSMVGRQVGAFADVTVLTAMKSGRYPSQEDYRRVSGEVRAAYELYSGQGYFDDPLSFHRPPPPLERVDVRSAQFGTRDYDWLTFASEYEPDPDDPVRERWLSHRSNREVHAWVWRHADESRPWLICLHGLGTGHPLMDFPAFRARWLFEDLGFNLAFPVLPLHGPRRDREVPRGALLSADLVDTLHGLSQAIWDVRRVIGWARDNGATRVGLYGLSMGAFAAALVSLVEEVDFVMAGIPLSDVPSLFAAHSDGKSAHLAHRSGMLGAKVNRLFTLVSADNHEPLVPHENRFIIAGISDRITTPAQARRLLDAWDRPTHLWYHGGHISYFWSRRVERFVAAALGKFGEIGEDWP